MNSRESALAALGLPRGARRTEIDEAYRRLIKLHHPDRSGGDGGRAAEINHAYTFLRRETLPAARRIADVPVIVRPPPRQSRRSALVPALLTFALFCGVAGGIAGLSGRDFGSRAEAIRWPSIDAARMAGTVTPMMDFDEPLNSGVIDSAIAQAANFRSANDLDGASAYSRDCQHNLRSEPNLVWFDACAAFDESIATLGEGDAKLQDGPFSDSELMSRELAAARDSLGADLRLHQIRSQVQMKLLPTMDPAAAEKL